MQCTPPRLDAKKRESIVGRAPLLQGAQPFLQRVSAVYARSALGRGSIVHPSSPFRAPFSSRKGGIEGRGAWFICMPGTHSTSRCSPVAATLCRACLLHRSGDSPVRAFREAHRRAVSTGTPLLAHILTFVRASVCVFFFFPEVRG